MHSYLLRRSALLLAGALVLGSLMAGGGATAATFDIVGGQSYTLQADFDPNWNAVPQGFDGSGPGTSIDVFYSVTATSSQATTATTFSSPTASGTGLEITGATGPVSLTYTYLGFEAAFINQAEDSFTFGSTPMFQNRTFGSMAATTKGASSTVTITPPNTGLVPFLFNTVAYDSNNTPSSSGLAINGGPIGSNVALGFLLDPSNPAIAYVLLEDIWQGGDADFDDMIVQIQINTTSTTNTNAAPLPPSLPLFAAGVLLMSACAWRRKSKLLRA